MTLWGRRRMKKMKRMLQFKGVKIQFYQLARCVLKCVFFALSIGVVFTSTLVGYLMAQEFKNTPLYYDYMQKCVEEGGEYLSCHQGKGS